MGNYQKFVFTSHPENAEMRTVTYCIDYMNNNVKWTATYSDNKFHHYQNGDKNKEHDSDHLDYETSEGKLQRLVIRDGKMYVGSTSGSLTQGTMVYKGWDGKTWSADLVCEINLHPDLVSN